MSTDGGYRPRAPRRTHAVPCAGDRAVAPNDPAPSLRADALRGHRVRQDRERAESLHPWPDLGLVLVVTMGTPIDPNFSRAFCPLVPRRACAGGAAS